MFNRKLMIDNTLIGEQQAPYIIAEISANHNGSIDAALACISAAKKAGANAVKIQTYTADTMTIQSDKEDFQIQEGPWQGYSLYDLYQQAHTPYEWHQALFEHAKKEAITLFSTPFDETAVDLLESLDAPAYKVASFELTDHPLLKRVGETGKPVILSTGMANEQEIKEAVDVLAQSGCQDLVLLHCISAYPAPIESSNLTAIRTLSDKFNTLSGLSDHSLGTSVANTAISLGACVVEKHFTLSRSHPGPDSAFSIEPDELKTLCESTYLTWQSLGTGELATSSVEQQNLQFRRSIYVVKDMKAGDVFSKENIRCIRPGFGLEPKYFEKIVGQVALTDLSKGTPLSLSHVTL